MRSYVLRAVALVACVAAVMLLVFLLVSGFVKADSADFEGLVASVREVGVTIGDAALVKEDGATVASFTVRSESSTDRVDAVDKAAEEKILRQAQQFRDKGLDVDELSFAVLNQKGETILTMKVPLDRTIDPSWYEEASTKAADVQTWARAQLASDAALKPLQARSVSLDIQEDGARVLTLDLAVADLGSGQEAMSKVMRDFRWKVDDYNASFGAKIALVCIKVADSAGTPLVDFVADLELQHDQAWLAQGVLPPGPSPAPSHEATQ
jgi:hypothetical protein